MLALLFAGCQPQSPDGGDPVQTDLPLHTPATLAWIDRSGQIEPIDIPARNYIYAQISPDGTRIALNARDETSDIWIYDLRTAALRRLTPDASANIGPLWAPDGRLAYTRIINDTQEIALQETVGTRPPETLSILSDNNKYPTSFAPDGRTLIFHKSTYGYDMYALSIREEGNTERPLLTSDSRETNGVLSPDGRWLAYELDESGQLEIYVSPYPYVGAGRERISANGSSRPHWHPNGNELFYIDQYDAELSGALMAVGFDENSGTRTDPPELLFEGIFHSPIQGQGRQLYDVSADGERFLMIIKASQVIG